MLIKQAYLIISELVCVFIQLQKSVRFQCAPRLRAFYFILKRWEVFRKQQQFIIVILL